jgi:hypothetical protein
MSAGVPRGGTAISWMKTRALGPSVHASWWMTWKWRRIGTPASAPPRGVRLATSACTETKTTPSPAITACLMASVWSSSIAT